jgi:hypothetical protein
MCLRMKGVVFIGLGVQSGGGVYCFESMFRMVPKTWLGDILCSSLR